MSSVSLYKFYITSDIYKDESHHNQAIGHVVVNDGQVRLKKNNQIEWSGFTSRETQVNNLDKIHTPFDSSALLQLHEIGEVNLLENSIIRVGKLDGVMEIIRGNVIIKLKRGRKLRIRVKGRSISAVSDQAESIITIDTSEEKIEVKADTATVTASEEFELTNESYAPPALNIINTLEQEDYFAEEDSEPYNELEDGQEDESATKSVKIDQESPSLPLVISEDIKEQKEQVLPDDHTLILSPQPEQTFSPPPKAPVEEKEEEGVYEMAVGANLGRLKRDVKDVTTNAKGNITSNIYYELLLSSRIPFSETWAVELGLSYRHLTFPDPSSKTLVAQSENFLSFSLGAVKKFHQFTFGFGALYDQVPLITGVDANAIGLTKFDIYSPYLSSDWVFSAWNNHEFSLGGLIVYNLSDKVGVFELESGYRARLSLRYQRQVSKNASYSLTPFIQYGSQTTNTVEHTDLDFGTQLQYHFKL